MEISGAAQAGALVSMAGQAIKDNTGGQIITKTLDHMNSTGGQINPDYQFQKDVLAGAGIGTMVDSIA